MGDRTVRPLARRLTGLLAAALLLVQPGPAFAWGFYGHRTTAQIALANVEPATRAEIARLIAQDRAVGTPECRIRSLADASVWPDCVRRDYWRWGYTAAWHYRTAPICQDYDPKANCSGQNCVLAQIERNYRILADERLPDPVRLEALAFLVHFVGDVHMPLHSGDSDDRGGNDRIVDYGIVPDLNLHWIWDGPLAERAISSAEPPLVRRYSPAERAELGGGEPAEWGRESWRLAREVAYRTAFDRDPCAGELPLEGALTQDDIVAAIPYSQRRVQQAGVRMARLLDEAFAPGPLPEPDR